MSNRSNNIDDRQGHDGVDRDPAHRPGPCISLDPGTIKPRTNVTKQDDDVQIEALASLSFEAQKEAIRRSNSILLSRIMASIRNSKDVTETTISALAKCSTIAKQWTAEERQQSGSRDPRTMTDEELGV